MWILLCWAPTIWQASNPGYLTLLLVLRASRPLSPCAQAHDASASAAGVDPGRTASRASPWWGASARILPWDDTLHTRSTL